MTKQYIGDGVYAEYDGFQIKLTAENGIEVLDTIYLEPRTFENLIEYNESLKKLGLKDEIV